MSKTKIATCSDIELINELLKRGKVTHESENEIRFILGDTGYCVVLMIQALPAKERQPEQLQLFAETTKKTRKTIAK